VLLFQVRMSLNLLEDPQDAEVATQYKSDIQAFNKTAKLWTENYAKNVAENKIKEIMDMGFSEEDAKIALQKNGFDTEKAVNFLLSKS
jgi:ubiquitin-conjugating enzyme (huntingtin interacting protein 2)